MENKYNSILLIYYYTYLAFSVLEMQQNHYWKLLFYLSFRSVLISKSFFSVHAIAMGQHAIFTNNILRVLAKLLQRETAATVHDNGYAQLTTRT